jgi:hypothetical protein
MVKKVVTAVMFLAVLSAGALSVRQLRTGSRMMAACGAPCVKTTACQKPCGLCYIVSGTTGVCQPEGPPPPPDLRIK